MSELVLGDILGNIAIRFDIDGTLGYPGEPSIRSLELACRQFAHEQGIGDPISPWAVPVSQGAIPPCTDEARISQWLEAVGRSDLFTRSTVTHIARLRADNYEPDLTLFPGTLEGLKMLTRLGLSTPTVLTGNPGSEGYTGRPAVVTAKLAELLKHGLIGVDSFAGVRTKLEMLTIMKAAASATRISAFYAGDDPIDYASWLDGGGERMDFLLRTNGRDCRITHPGRYSNGGHATSYFNVNDPLMRLGFVTPYLPKLREQLTYGLEALNQVLENLEMPAFNRGALRETMFANLGNMLLENVTIPETPDQDSGELTATMRCLLFYYLNARVSPEANLDTSALASFPLGQIYPHRQLRRL